MKWNIPAKTFLLGEYAAVAEASAIILATTPLFELTLTDKKELQGIHPDSPAGLWWQQAQCAGKGLTWQDPYNGRGGLGASSAQFLGCYLATCHLQNITPTLNTMLSAYYQVAWNGGGLRPSGYDVIAQSQQGCVYVNKQSKIVQSYEWPFADLSFVILHTGKKLATHYHLQSTPLPNPDQIIELSAIVDAGKDAFEQQNSKKIIDCVNDYQQKLSALRLVAPHTVEAIATLKKNPEILAIKGCGALGADTILLITKQDVAASLRDKLIAEKWLIIATDKDLTAQDNTSLLNNRL